MKVTRFVSILFSAPIRKYFAESYDKAKLYEQDHTRNKFSNPYSKKVTHALKLNNSS